MCSSLVRCDASSNQRPPYKRRCLPTLLTPPTLTHPFLLPAAVSTNRSRRNIWLSIFCFSKSVSRTWPSASYSGLRRLMCRSVSVLKFHLRRWVLLGECSAAPHEYFVLSCVRETVEPSCSQLSVFLGYCVWRFHSCVCVTFRQTASYYLYVWFIV